MKFIFSMPFWSCPPNPAFLSQEAIMELSAEVEAAGFEAVAFTEHPAPTETWRLAHGHDALDPFVALALCSAATKRLKLLTYVIVLPYRNPLLLAKTAATLDKLSGGRLMLGLGAGYQEAEFAALGVRFDQRKEIFDESLEVLKLAWTGEPVHYKGLNFDAQGVTSQPIPQQRPGPPLWMGGNSKLTMRRLAKHGAGWLVLPNTPEQAARNRSTVMNLDTIGEHLEMLDKLAKEAGRTDKIEVHYPLGHAHDKAPIAVTKELAGRVHAMGIGWSGWNPVAETMAEMKDEIRRFSDEVISRYGG